MATRLCQCCSAIFAGEPRPREELPHHSSFDSLINASESGCYVCRTIAKSEAAKSIDSTAPFQTSSYITPLTGKFSGWFNLTIDASPSDEEIDQWFYDDISDPSEDGPNLPEAPIWGFHLIPVEGNPPQNFKIPTTMKLQDPEFQQMVQGWMSVCSSEHSHPEDSGYRPTRLIEITNDIGVRLIVTKEHPYVNFYATLSHCWGKAKTCKLLASNLKELQAEGIAVCKALGIRYIWIDSLCIIQDSKADWNREALTMRDVYRNGTINVAAAAAAESSQPSFLERDVQLIDTIEVTAKLGVGGPQRYHIMYPDMFKAEVEQSPLRQRAWVVQEVYLSKRNLYLTSGQLWWECGNFKACDGFPSGVPKALRPSPGIRYRRTWNRLVETYTSCQLTFISDRMVAFAGIVDEFKTSNPEDSYEAGIWRSHLPVALLWETEGLRGTYRPSTYRAPSWSWVSVEGPISSPSETLEDRPTEIVAEVLDITSIPGDGADIATFRGARLELSGHLTEVRSFDNKVQVKGSDGSFGFIEGSLDHMQTLTQNQGNYTMVTLDEFSNSNEDILSYLDRLDATDLASNIFEKATRVTAVWKDWTMDLYSLLLITQKQDEDLLGFGLLLCRLDIEGQSVYQRVGTCHAYGELTTNKLLESAKANVLII
ncbi:HET-domain-containing protein [Xylaria palmicola]|nr:HET-domain-containing protein [Xylaria palmicola]